MFFLCCCDGVGGRVRGVEGGGNGVRWGEGMGEAAEPERGMGRAQVRGETGWPGEGGWGGGVFGNEDEGIK